MEFNFVQTIYYFLNQSVVQEEDKAMNKIYKEMEFEADMKFHLVSSIMSFILVSKLILSFDLK